VLASALPSPENETEALSVWLFAAKALGAWVIKAAPAGARETRTNLLKIFMVVERSLSVMGDGTFEIFEIVKPTCQS
jgi:hypothetical protein